MAPAEPADADHSVPEPGLEGASLQAELALHGTAVLERGVVPGALVLLGDGEILWSGPVSYTHLTLPTILLV